MKKLLVILVAGVFAACAAQTEVTSLRGATAIPESAGMPPAYQPDNPDKKYDRTFKEQPPLVAHRVDDQPKYKINLQENGCLGCHDKSTYKEEDAPMASKSHYVGPDGAERDTIVMSRYFCTQCHVPQTNAKPLVENTFVGNK